MMTSFVTTFKTVSDQRRSGAFAMLASGAMALGLAMAAAVVPAQAHDFKKGELVLDHPWSRATAKGAKVAGGYLVVKNAGSADDVLVGGDTSIAEKVEIHEMAVTDGVMTMRKLDDGLAVPANGQVELKPGSYHIMFQGLKRQLVEGESFDANLVFSKAGTVAVSFKVEGIGKRDSGHDHDGHGGHGADHGKHDGKAGNQ